MGRSTWEQVFRLCLAESANSTMISANARQKPKAFAAAGSEASHSRAQGCSAWPQPSEPSLTRAAQKAHKCPVLTHKTALSKQGWEQRPAARARETGNHGRTWLSLEQPLFSASWTSICSLQLPPSSSTSHGDHWRTIKQFTFYFSVESPISLWCR